MPSPNRKARKKNPQRTRRTEERWRQGHDAVSIDASAKFRSGAEYRNITEFRKLMETDASRDRFVRCFITKLLTYANGTEPEDYTEIEKILEKSAANDYRIVDTIAAVVDSPLFRED